nr:hypothetical protein [Nocardiopsis sp. 90127]
MRTRTPQVTPVVSASERPCKTCGDYYDISDPADSYPHNNGQCA